MTDDTATGPSPEAYVRHRLRHPHDGQNASARAVGYAHGRPTAPARELWEHVQALLEHRDILDHAAGEQERLEEQLETSEERATSLRAKIRAQKHWQRAGALLEEYEAEEDDPSSA